MTVSPISRAWPDGALQIADGFFNEHHGFDHGLRVKITGIGIQQAVQGLGQDARNEAVPHLRAAGVAAGRIEGEAGQCCAGPDKVW